MVDPTLEHQRLGLSGRVLSLALAAKYLLLGVYGVWATIEEVPSFVTVGGSPFAITWAATVAATSAVALIGVARTWLTGRYRLEKWTTAVLILTFATYGIVLIVRAMLTGDSGSMPLCILPFALVGFPTVRYYSLVSHGSRS